MDSPWALPKERLLQQLKTSPERGLTSVEASVRYRRFGPNELRFKTNLSIGALIFRQLINPLVLLLLLAGIIAIVQGQLGEGEIIFAIVLINASVGLVQEYKAEKIISSLRKILSDTAQVVRDGTERTVSARYLVPGDLVVLAAGAKVPADARLLSAAGLLLNQATLTGESLPVAKYDGTLSPTTNLLQRTNLLYQSTFVVAGRATAVVVATGNRTEVGQIAQTLSGQEPLSSTLERQIGTLSFIFLFIGLACALALVGVGLWRNLDLLDSLKLGTALLVSIVPESLPIIVTVLLSVGLVRLFREQVVIRQLGAVEVLGAVTTLCLDKTGTVTEGKMMVEQISTVGEEYRVTGIGYQLTGQFFRGAAAKPVDLARDQSLRAFLELVSLSTVSTISEKERRTDEALPGADPTETALAVLAAKANFFRTSEERHHREVAERPFAESRHYSFTVHQFGTTERLVIKGAPEKVLALCTHQTSLKGEAKVLLPASRAALEQQSARYAAAGYRHQLF